MKILITGGAGFLGRRLARELLAPPGPASDTAVTLADVVATDAFAGDGRVRSVVCDIADPGQLAGIVTPDTEIVFHLAAVLSGQAEREFDLGMKVNIDATRALLECARRQARPPTFIFASSLAVFGGGLPPVVDDATAVAPQSSYGTQKAVGELLVNDYSRKGYVDGRVLRLPTIAVRPGPPSQATSSFASAIIREPLRGEPAVCPVGPDTLLWLSSPRTVVANLIRGARVPAADLGPNRTVNLPGLSVTVAAMIQSLEKVAGRTAAGRIRFERNETIDRIISSWPGRFDTTRARALGFGQDADFESVVRDHVAETAAASIPV